MTFYANIAAKGLYIVLRWLFRISKPGSGFRIQDPKFLGSGSLGSIEKLSRDLIACFVRNTSNSLQRKCGNKEFRRFEIEFRHFENECFRIWFSLAILLNHAERIRYSPFPINFGHKNAIKRVTPWNFPPSKSVPNCRIILETIEPFTFAAIKKFSLETHKKAWNSVMLEALENCKKHPEENLLTFKEMF